MVDETQIFERVITLEKDVVVLKTKMNIIGYIAGATLIGTITVLIAVLAHV